MLWVTVGYGRLGDVTETAPPAKSPELRALEYAEEVLGVHSIHADAVKHRDRLDKILTELADLRDKLRFEEASLVDEEMQIIIEERGKHPDMSVSGMDRHLKIKMRESDEVRERKETVAKLKSEVEGLEFDKTISETDIKIAQARMNELGGYFQYLAAIKLSALQRAHKVS